METLSSSASSCGHIKFLILQGVYYQVYFKCPKIFEYCRSINNSSYFWTFLPIQHALIFALNHRMFGVLTGHRFEWKCPNFPFMHDNIFLITFYCRLPIIFFLSQLIKHFFKKVNWSLSHKCTKLHKGLDSKICMHKIRFLSVSDQ